MPTPNNDSPPQTTVRYRSSVAKTLSRAATTTNPSTPALSPASAWKTLAANSPPPPTNRPAFIVAFLITLAVILWAFFAPDSLHTTGTTKQT